MKVKKVTGRGTGSRKADVNDQNWSGDKYREEQKKKKEAAKNRTVSMGRGTKRVRLGDLPDPKPRSSTAGRTRITGRGTGSRKSKNKGSS